MADIKAKDYKKGTTSYMDQEQKIRRGQAYNLAVAAAIAVGKATDKKEIFSFFVFYYELGSIAQTYSFEEIKKVLE